MKSSTVPWDKSSSWSTPKISPNVHHPCHHSKTTCLSVCMCVFVPTAATHFSPLIPTYTFTTGHAIMLVLSSAGQGTLSAMTSLHPNSCGVNKRSSYLTPEAKKDIKDCHCWFYCTFFHCHFWPDTVCVLIQCLDKNTFVLEMLLLPEIHRYFLTSPVKHLAHCLNRLFTDCLYLNIDSVTKSFGGDLFVK